jgi:hypothetical protein
MAVPPSTVKRSALHQNNATLFPKTFVGIDIAATTICLLSLCTLPLVTACGSDGSRGQDASATDGNEEYAGIGEACDGTVVSCTAPETDECLTPPNQTSGFCTLQCATDVSVVSDEMGNIPIDQIPVSSHETCMASFSGDGGVAECGVIVDFDPPVVGTPSPNTPYLITASCAVRCSETGNPCPTGLTCIGGQGGFCFELE